MICTVRRDCYLVATKDLVRDMSGNELVATELSSPGRQIQDLVTDSSTPTLEGFDLDLHDEVLTLSFSETIDASSVKTTGITFVRNGALDDKYTLTGGDVLDFDFHTIVVDLSSDDANAIRARHIASSGTDTYMSITSLTAEDMAYDPNFVDAIAPEHATLVTDYTRDDTDPKLTHFGLNLNEERGLLTLTFSEPVVPSVFDPKSIVLQRDSIATVDTPYYRLTGGDLAEESDVAYTEFEFAIRTITLILTKDDQTALKTKGRDDGLATDAEKTYLSVDSTLITDAAENSLAEIAPIGSELPALKITGELEIDDRFAVVKSVQLDLDAKTLTIEFDDVIQADTLKVHAITIQSGATDPAFSYDLKTSTTSSDDGYIMVVSLSAADELELNRIEYLASNEDTTYVAMRATAFKDVDGKNIVAVITAMQVAACTICGDDQSLSAFTPDTTSPTLDEFDINLSTGIMTMRFSEAVDLPTFTPTALVLSAAPNWVENAPPNDGSGSGDAPEEVSMLRLTGGLEHKFDAVQTTVTFKLVKADLDELKRIDGFATAGDDTYVSHDKTMISDMFGDVGVTVAPIESADAEIVTKFTKDTVRPTLESFWVDMDEFKLYLSFTEPIRLTTIVIPTNIGFLEAASAENDIVLIGEGATATTTDSLTVVVTITTVDMNRIKVVDPLYSDQSSSYITISDGLIKDMNNNMVNAIAAAGAKPAVDYNVDKTPPVLDTFAVNMNLGTIQFNFDEPVRVSTINLPGSVWAQRSEEYIMGEDQYDIQHSCNVHDESKCTSQDNDCCADINAGEPQTCAGGYYAFASGPGCNYECRKFCGENALQVILTLDETELNVIKQLDALFTKKEDTFMRFANTFIRDMAGVAMEEIPQDGAKRATVYFDDRTRPEIDSFDLDMASEPGVLTLSFSETVDISSLLVDKLSLQPAFAHTGTNAVSLTTGSVTTSEDGTSMSFVLRKEDFDSLKLNGVGFSKDTTWLTAEDGAILDMAGKTSLARENGVTAKQVSKITEDDVQPRMEKFDLNMHDGTIGLYFSEPVDADSFDATNFRLQEKQSQP